MKELIKSNFVSAILSTIFSAGAVFGIGSSIFSVYSRSYEIGIVFGAIGLVFLMVEIYLFSLVIKNEKSKRTKNNT